MDALGILLELAAAPDEARVERVLKDDFFKSVRWKPLGGTDNNYATVANQQSDPVNALCEKPVNSIDHILLKKCKAAGESPSGRGAPRDMKEALKRYSIVPSGDLRNLDAKQIRKMTGDVTIIADGRRKKPSITVVDRGEGQHPHDFESTLLSLQRGNKKRIKFVHGKYNMGGTGVLPFCGKNGYQLVLSRKSAEVYGGESKWGFTLIREKPDVDESYKTSWYEYFVDESDAIFTLPPKPLPVLPGGGMLRDGCLIKMFSYDLKQGKITEGLWAAMNTRLYAPALPVLLHDARAGINKKRAVYGNAWRVAKERQYVHKTLQIGAKLREFGASSFDVTVFKHASETDNENVTGQFRSKSEAVLLTQNGQLHASIKQAKLRSGAQLESLHAYMMVHVDLTRIPPSKAKMFLASRDRARASDDYANLEKKILDGVGNDDQIKKLDAEYKEMDERMSVRDDSMQEAISEVLRKNRDLADLMDPGVLPAGAGGPPPQPETTFEPSYVPTYLRVRSNRKTEARKTIPCDQSPAHVYLETDAPDDYTTRSKDSGTLEIALSKDLEGTWSGPAGGLVKITVCGKGEQYAQAGEINAQLSRPGASSLSCMVHVYFGAPAAAKKPSKKKNGITMPPFRWVYRKGWSVLGWKELTVGSADGGAVRVNRDCAHLLKFKKSRPASDGDRITALFGMHVYLASVALYHAYGSDDDYDDIYNKAIDAVARSCLAASHDLAGDIKAAD